MTHYLPKYVSQNVVGTGNHDASADDYNLTLYDEQWTTGASMRGTACYNRLLYDERLYDYAFVWALRWLVTPVERTCSI